ncbi:MAG: nucleotidyltransferase [Chloroflexota bacterium]|nr:nucleotidyltransferase [Chloroflexota bacterium]
MPIPASQFDTWANLHQTQTAQHAHAAVRDGLSRVQGAAWMGQVDDFLQGSYRNSTSIYRDGDVDLVLQFNGVCHYDSTALPFNDQIRVAAALPAPALYGFAQFRRDAVDGLTRVFGGADVDASGNKAIRVAAEPGVRLAADVVPCVQYRRYVSWDGNLSRGYVPGIAFWTKREGRLVANFPRQHIQNGWDKNARTADRYKKTVRVFKNAWNAAVRRGLLGDGVAPSYFVECLLSNVPDASFNPSSELAFLGAVAWLQEQRNAGALTGFWCQNGVVPLFGPSKEQWRLESAAAFIDAMYALYMGW